MLITPFVLLVGTIVRVRIQTTMKTTKKSGEQLMEEAIQKQKARDAKRKAICLKDDCELEETQIYPTDFKGSHPLGEDSNKKNRQKWVKNLQNPDPYARFYKIMFWFTAAYLAIHLIVAFIRSNWY